MSKQELHARIKEENSVNLDSIALSEKRSRSSMTDILLSEAIEARLRVNNRIKELKEEMKCTGCMPGDNGMSFVCREQHINKGKEEMK